jgi:hypothetical protein
MAIDKESHSNKKVTVTVLYSQKIPILIDIELVVLGNTI